jgi:hypothetical protein
MNRPVPLRSAARPATRSALRCTGAGRHEPGVNPARVRASGSTSPPVPHALSGVARPRRNGALLRSRLASLNPFAVAPAGLEPARPCGPRILNPPRLPFRHGAEVFDVLMLFVLLSRSPSTSPALRAHFPGARGLAVSREPGSPRPSSANVQAVRPVARPGGSSGALCDRLTRRRSASRGASCRSSHFNARTAREPPAPPIGRERSGPRGRPPRARSSPLAPPGEPASARSCAASRAFRRARRTGT